MDYQYCKPVPRGDVATRVREIICEICKSMDIEIIRGHVYVHLFVSVPPYHSASIVMKRIKGKRSCKLLSESRLLAKQFWDWHLWARGYFAATSGNVTDKVIAQYIENQGHIERASDDDFTIGYVDVVDADLSKYFDTTPHPELTLYVARRISDRDVLGGVDTIVMPGFSQRIGVWNEMSIIV